MSDSRNRQPRTDAEIWTAIGALADDGEVQAWRREALQAAESARANQRARSRYRHWASGLAAAAAAVLMAIALVFMASGERYSTRHGEQKTVTLEDGSTVQLNTDTEVRVRIDESRRDVKLVRGEALFTVTHDVERPFRTLAGDDVITDLGTRFAVRLEDGWSQVGVLEGKVAVARGGGPTLTLEAGQEVRTRDDDWRVQSAPDGSLARWAAGRLTFHDVPLAEVVREANRYGPPRLVLEDESLSSLRVNGDFGIGNPLALAHALESAFPVRVEIVDDEVHLLRRD